MSTDAHRPCMPACRDAKRLGLTQRLNDDRQTLVASICSMLGVARSHSYRSMHTMAAPAKRSADDWQDAILRLTNAKLATAYGTLDAIPRSAQP
jgi:hypothetical protein